VPINADVFLIWIVVSKLLTLAGMLFGYFVIDGRFSGIFVGLVLAAVTEIFAYEFMLGLIASLI